MSLDYFKAMNQQGYQVVISGLKGGAIQGVLTDEVAFGGGNEWQAAQDTLADVPIVGKIAGVKNQIEKFVNMKGASATPIIGTRLNWTGSRKPRFNISLAFYAMSVDQKPTMLDILLRLQSAVLPTSEAGGVFLKAPLGYDITAKKGTLMLSMGTWFRATNLVMVDVNMVPSHTIMANGQPNFITGTVTLEPHQAITFEDFKNYIQV